MTALLQRKLKVRQAFAPARVAVFQDGNAADADVTAGYRFDNAFQLGALAPGRTLDSEREYISLGELKSSYASGRELTFQVLGMHAWKNDTSNAMVFTPNSIVEFFAQVPDAGTVTGALSLPSWHLNTATPGTQVRLFVGHITNVTCRPDGGLDVTCRDPMWRANQIKLQREAANGITIPKIAFNVPRDNPEFFYSIKITNAAAPSPWATGESKEADSRMTLKQVLEYLRSRYNTQLVSEGVLDGAYSGAIFHDADLAPLTYKPGPIVLENTGFADGVREILRRWAPQLRIMVDARTSQWRLLKYGPALAEGFATAGILIEQNFPTHLPYGAAAGPCDNVALFSAVPGANGNRVRVYGKIPSLNEELVIHSIVGSELRFFWPIVRSYAGANAPLTIHPIVSDAMPSLLLSVDDTPDGGSEVGLDLDGIYTAVNIYSVYQKTESRAEHWNRQSLGGGPLQPGWDPAHESVWTDKDADRTGDLGADGQGMKPYSLGNDGTNDWFAISFNQSQYANKHTTGEWIGCSLWIWTENGADKKNLNRTYTIKNVQSMANVGDGTPGLKIILEAGVGQVLSDSPAFKTISDPSATEDRLVLTQDYRFVTTKANNRKWEVGRKFYFTDTTVQFDNSDTPHVATCTPLRIVEDDGTESPRRAIGMHPNLGYPATNTNAAQGWETLAAGGLGATHVWRRSTYSRKPTGSPCGQQGWKPPKLVQVEYETTTTTMRNARYPAIGFAGVAYARYGLTAELSIAVENWAEDKQTPDYAALAEKLWQVHSHAHHRGSVRKPGIKENGVWLDLSIRCSLHSTISSLVYSGPVGGNFPSGSPFEGFWGSLTELSYDFENDEVVFGFDSQDRAEQLAVEVYEEFGVAKKSTTPDLMALYRKLHELPKCLQGSMTGEGATAMCGSRVYDGKNKTILKTVNVFPKAQQDAGASFSGAAHS